MGNEEASTNNTSEQVEKIEFRKITVYQFILLSFATFGLYSLWWVYNSWYFFKDKEKTDIKPAVRALFSVFFLIPLFNKILKLAKVKGYANSYSPILLYLVFLIFNIFANIPEPYFLLTIFSAVSFIQPLNALNYAADYCDDFKVVEKRNFNGRQIALIVVGGLFWILIILGLFVKYGTNPEFVEYM